MAVNTEQVLARAKDMIIRKQYAEADQVLVVIKDDVTAQKWRRKIREIARVPLTPQETQAMEVIRGFITAKDYVKARERLLALQHLPQAFRWLGRLDESRGRPTSAMNETPSRAASAPSPNILLTQEAPAIHSLESDANLDNKRKAEEYVNQAHRYENEDNELLAKKAYDNAIQLAPMNVDYLFFRGNCYQNLNEPFKALIDYNKALSLDPTATQKVSLYRQRGFLHQELNRSQEALDDFRQYLRYANGRDDPEIIRDVKSAMKSLEQMEQQSSFVGHYWVAFLLLGLALFSLGLYAVLGLMVSQDKDPSALSKLLIIPILLTIVRSLQSGWRPRLNPEGIPRDGEGCVAGCLGLIILFVITLLIWPLAEIWRQVTFLNYVRKIWEQGKFPINDKDKPIRSG